MCIIVFIYELIVKWITNRISKLDNNQKFQAISDVCVIRNKAGVILIYKSKNCSENILENLKDYEYLKEKR